MLKSLLCLPYLWSSLSWKLPNFFTRYVIFFYWFQFIRLKNAKSVMYFLNFIILNLQYLRWKYCSYLLFLLFAWLSMWYQLKSKYWKITWAKIVHFFDYRISSYSFRPWIVSAHLCSVTFGFPSSKRIVSSAETISGNTVTIT